MRKTTTLTTKRFGFIMGILFAASLVTLVLVTFFGRPALSMNEILFSESSWAREIFYYVRLPRVLLGFLVGAALSVTGVNFQSLLRNPLADPYILGVSGGAALGGVVGLALGLSFQLMLGVSFIFALLSLVGIYWIAQVGGRLSSSSLLLTGLMFNAFAFALVLLINALVEIGQSQQIIYLLMGSLEATSWNTVLWLFAIVFLGVIVTTLLSKNLNVMSLGEEAALRLGVNDQKLRKIFFVVSSLMVGASVAVAGLIGFVGLFVPHVLRLIFGPDHRLLIPASALGGGIFLVVCDFIARSVVTSGEVYLQLPVGVITALTGGPFFIFLLRKQRASIL